jgi:glycerol-3-phosphate dehydrogenase
VGASEPYDVFIVGGGINGCGIARDAAGRGFSVCLAEMNDLASGTSSWSTKLIHGGLRYLEHREFRLVRESLAERERLLESAPHIIWPLRFLLPHEPSLRPAWMLRLGLFLYDHLGGRRRLPGSAGIDLVRDPMGAGLRPAFRRGFVYSDCWVDDARLVVLNAMDAVERGADLRTRTRCVAARRDRGCWRATIEDRRSGLRREVRARILVDAAGPWVKRFLEQEAGLPARHSIRLVKGSHIVVPRLYDGSHAHILQNVDRRVVFATPYERRFTLIGTTDVPFAGDLDEVAITAEETSYLCAAVSRYFRKPVAPTDVVWSYAGVRPLYDDAAASASEVTRDYVLDLDAPAGEAPLLAVFGGKITTYRRLAEHALEKLRPFCPDLPPAWTERAVLPGGDMANADFERFLGGFRARHPWLPAPLARRYARAYGTRAERLIGGARSLADLGECFGGDLHLAELEYLAAAEWAEGAEDVLWRRSKLGLHLPAGAERWVDAWFAARSATVGRQRSG